MPGPALILPSSNATPVSISAAAHAAMLAASSVPQPPLYACSGGASGGSAFGGAITFGNFQPRSIPPAKFVAIANKGRTASPVPLLSKPEQQQALPPSQQQVLENRVSLGQLGSLPVNFQLQLPPSNLILPTPADTSSFEWASFSNPQANETLVQFDASSLSGLILPTWNLQNALGSFPTPGYR